MRYRIVITKEVTVTKEFEVKDELNQEITALSKAEAIFKEFNKVEEEYPPLNGVYACNETSGPVTNWILESVSWVEVEQD